MRSSKLKVQDFNEDAIKQTKSLLERYYKNQIEEPILYFELQRTVKHLKEYPEYPVLELLYVKDWSIEQIAGALKCKESQVQNVLNKIINRAALYIFGVTALKCNYLTP